MEDEYITRSSYKQMNSELIKLIASRMDDSVLEVASKSRLWEVISPLLIDQSFWYRRTQTLVNFDLEWNEKENWHQVYNILSSLEEGSNPFSEARGGVTVLELNGYNLTAVKLLLRLKYDPSIDHSMSLTTATIFDSPEVIQLLLNDPRIDPLDNAAIFALRVAAEQGRTDKIKVLLGDSRIGISHYALQLALYVASEKNQLEVMKLLIQEPIVDEILLNGSLMGASKEGSLDVMRLLLQDSRVNPNTGDGEALNQAILKEQTEAVRLLLQDKRLIIQPGSWGHMHRAIISDNADVVRLLLADHRVIEDEDHILIKTSRDGRINVVKMLLEGEVNITEQAIELAAENGHSLILSLLLSDPRTNKPGEIPLEMLESQGYRPQVVNVLIRDTRVKIDEIGPNIIRVILDRISQYTSNYVKRSGLLSGRSEGNILKLISKTCNSFTKCHHSMLLRELILKRLNLEYYLRWILKQLKKEDTSSEVRRLFSTAARSLSEESPVHTSPNRDSQARLFFTAYRGFFLLTVSDDSEVIMNTLRSEEGVTQEGINLAGMLIGAYLGGR